MGTLATIQNEVLRIVEDHVTVVTAAITTHIQRAQRAIEDRVAFPIQQTATVFQYIATPATYTLPTNFISVESAPYYLAKTTSTQYTFMTEVEEFEPLGLQSTNPGPPKYWRLEQGLYFDVWPYGDGLGPSASVSGAYEIAVPYYQRLATLTAGSDTNWWTSNLEDVLAWKAASLVFAEMRDPMAGFWGAVAAARFKEIVSQMRRNQIRQRGASIYPEQQLSAGTNRRRLTRRIQTTLP